MSIVYMEEKLCKNVEVRVPKERLRLIYESLFTTVRGDTFRSLPRGSNLLCQFQDPQQSETQLLHRPARS
jgi:hypothetical protein